MKPRIAGWTIWLVIGVAIAGLGAAVLVAGLDDADKYASVAGGVSALVGLGMSLTALVRRQPQRPLPPEEPSVENQPGQTMASNTIGGDAIQIWGIGRSVRIGRTPTPPEPGATPQAPADSPTQPVPEDAPAPEHRTTQSIRDSRIAGSAVQIGQVGEDVDIERSSDG